MDLFKWFAGRLPNKGVSQPKRARGPGPAGTCAYEGRGTRPSRADQAVRPTGNELSATRH